MRFTVRRTDRGYAVWDHATNGLWSQLGMDLSEAAAAGEAERLNYLFDMYGVRDAKPPPPPPRSPVDAGPAPTGWHQVLEPPLLVLARQRGDGTNAERWDEAYLMEREREPKNWIGLIWVKGRAAPRWIHEDEVREHPDARPD